MPVLARRLAVTGDYAGTPNDAGPPTGRNCRKPSSDSSAGTGSNPTAPSAPRRAQLNVPVAQLIQQIALNLERWRWLPADLGERHILVNIPEYRLEVWDHGQVPLSMRVVVGK